MEEKIMLGEFIYFLRKEKGLTQAELADILGISNKAVSKWETCEANPEINLLPKLAETLGVTTDELLNCKKQEKYAEPVNEMHERVLGFDGIARKSKHCYEFISDKKTKNGRPFLHINTGLAFGLRANGVIAIGNNAKGIISIGLISRGVISLGILSIGIVSIGILSLGLLLSIGAVALGFGLSVGAVAVGAVAVGAVAIGYVSVGAVAIGYYAHSSPEGVAIGVKRFIHINNYHK